MTSNGGSPIPHEMWDVALAEQLGTTPWDVRANATVWDIMRVKEWIVGKNAQTKVQDQRHKARMNSSTPTARGRGRRR